MGTALLLVFVHLLTFIPLGTPAQAIGHITFSLVFVIIIVRARLLAIGPQYEEAARDLGASRIQAVRLALLPMLVPAIVASGIIVFAISMDDFVISAFLSSGTSTDTVPVRIYSTGRTAPTPALNALATLTLLLTIVVTVLGFLLWRGVRAVRRDRRARQSASLRRWTQSPSLPGEYSRSGRLAGANRALHVHVAEARDVRARPVDGSDRAAHVRAEARETADAERRGVRPARPLLRRPVGLDVLRRLQAAGPTSFAIPSRTSSRRA